MFRYFYDFSQACVLPIAENVIPTEWTTIEPDDEVEEAICAKRWKNKKSNKPTFKYLENFMKKKKEDIWECGTYLETIL